VLALSRKEAKETAGRRVNSREVSSRVRQEPVPALPLTTHDSFVR